MGKTLENVIIVILVIVILYMLFKNERMDGDVAPTSLSVPQATPPPPELVNQVKITPTPEITSTELSTTDITLTDLTSHQSSSDTATTNIT